MAHSISVELLVQHLDGRLRLLRDRLTEVELEAQQLQGAIEELCAVKRDIQSQNLNQCIFGCE